jgi:seryl-tRNA synthetase
MVDVSGVIENIEYHKQNVMERRIRRPAIPELDQLAQRYEQWKSLKATLAKTRHEQKLAGLEIQAATTENAKNAALKRASEIKQFILSQEHHLTGLDKFIQGVVLSLPNTTHRDAPIGPDPCAVVQSEHGPEPAPPSELRDHASIMESLGMIDFKTASLVAGGSWYYLRGAGALLETALTNYALSVAIKHGWEPFTTPDAIRTDVALRCGFQPRDVNTAGMAEVHHFYHLEHTSGDLVLTGTAEIPLAGFYANQTFTEQDIAKRFPIKMVGVGHAFRSEAGARGKDTRGLYRVHQFTKVELFALTGDEASEVFMADMLSLQREIFSGLGFPYR